MKSRWLRTVASCVLLLAPAPAAFAAVAGTGLPAHEVWFGLGGASSPEKDIFNVPNDLESKPELVLNLSYMHNLDAQKAFGIHLYGATETTPTVTVVDESGSPQNTTFDLYTYNLGVRYRHTFMRGSLSPYAFVGAGWAFGTVEASITGSLKYTGFSACVGPGAVYAFGGNFRVSAELFGSFGSATWEQKPFGNSTGDEFNPGLLGGTLNLGLAWGALK